MTEPDLTSADPDVATYLTVAIRFEGAHASDLADYLRPEVEEAVLGVVGHLGVEVSTEIEPVEASPVAQRYESLRRQR